MDLTALRAAVQTLVRDGTAPPNCAPMLTAQRAALRALRHDLQQTGGDAEQLVPLDRAWDWMSPPPRPETFA